jgi:integrase
LGVDSLRRPHEPEVAGSKPAPAPINDSSVIPDKECCPECGSKGPFCRSGLRYLVDGSTIQRLLCRKCSYRFSAKPNPSKPAEAYNYGYRGSNDGEAGAPTANPAVKLLVDRGTRQEMGPREPTTDTKGRIVEYLWYLTKKGRSEATLDAVNRRLSQLMRAGLNLLNPEEVSSFLSKQNCWSNRTKACDVSIYSGFLRFHKVAWDPPEYKTQRKPYVLPHEEDLEQLINAAGRRLSPFLLVLKETAARKSEAAQLRWENVDLDRKLVSIAPKKGGNPRTLPISDRLAEVLRCQNRGTERVFNATLSSISSNYYQQRKKIARKTGNPRLLQIGLHDFRHWKLTQVAKEFNGNAHYVQYFAGHRDLNTQQLYVHLAEQYYGKNSSSEFVVEVAKTVEEASKLLAVGFEFVHEHQGAMICRKRK